MTSAPTRPSIRVRPPPAIGNGSCGSGASAVTFADWSDPNRQNFRAFGSATDGLRLSGKLSIGDGLSIPYQASYAYQENWGNNPTSYGAHYTLVEVGLLLEEMVKISVGFEMLGTDTDAQIVPLFATAHKFNGFADAFLANGAGGGAFRGLRDLYASISPVMPLQGVKLMQSLAPLSYRLSALASMPDVEGNEASDEDREVELADEGLRDRQHPTHVSTGRNVPVSECSQRDEAEVEQLRG